LTSRRWSAANRPRKRQHRRNERAWLEGAEGIVTTAEWHRLLFEYLYACGYCGAWTTLTADHRTPLLRGGSNDITNLIPACRICNSRKGTMTESEYRELLSREGADRLSVAV
jgi:5-methylcytosine-specific restriction endonuclease McrA